MKKFSQLILILCVVSLPLFCDYTYLDYDKLVFGNGGGLQLVATDNSSYFLQILDIGSSDYVSKGFNIEGKFKSIIPTTENAYVISDFLAFDLQATFATENFPTVPSYYAAANLPTDYNFFIGELLGKSTLIKSNALLGIVKNPGVNSFSNAPIYIQEENGPVFMGLITNLNEPVLTIFPSVNGSPYIGINTMEPAEAITVSGDLRINGNIALTEPIGIFETGVTSPGTNFDAATIGVHTLLSDYEFTCPPYVTHNIMVISMISGKTTQPIGAYFWAYCLLKYKDSNGDWQLYVDPTDGIVITSISGLKGLKYNGYFNDNLDFFKTASIKNDSRFDNLFTSINATTPGANFDNYYSVKFYGYFKASITGTYTFYTYSDDSSWLWVGNSNETVSGLEIRRSNSNAIVDNSGVHGPTERSGTVDLVAGEIYPILIYFGENAGGDVIVVSFTPPGGSKTDDGEGFYIHSSSSIGTIMERSFTAFDGTIGITGFHLAPQFTALITPNDDGTEKEYKVELYAYNLDNYLTVETAKINILGLPSSSYVGAFTGYNLSNATTTLTSTIFAELDGNYLTDQVLSFGSGGGIVESGNSLVFTNGTDYLDFRASNITFGSFHYIDSLKVYSENSANNYPFQVGDGGGSNLGIDSYGSFYGGIVTANIQMLNGSNPNGIPLHLLSDIYIGDSISIIETTPTVNMEVGTVISDSDYALNVSGNILFTGEFKGTYGIIKSQYIDGTRGTESLMSDIVADGFLGYTFDDNPNDYIAVTLPAFSNWDLMMFSQMSVTIRDDSDDYMWIVLKNIDTNTTYTSEPTIIHSSASISWRHSFYNTFTQEGVPPGNYHIYLRMQARYSTSGPGIRTIDINGNGSKDSPDITLSYYRLSGTLGLIALPSE